ncbi:MAG: DUF4349 domain-containing protein [Deltaproteobacteria bacterium]|nr:DUF4349 domain-containing protein [Deltaproteobacteria bacterium]
MEARRVLVLVFVVALGCALACCGMDDRAAPPTDDASSPEEIIEIVTEVGVDDVANALHVLRTRAEELGGRIESSERSGSQQARMRVRVPTDSVASMRSELDGLDVHRSERETRLDVSRSHTDLSARLRSARATEERLITLLADRTASLADVLAAESELARVRTIIEQAESEERTLVDRVTYASLDVTLTEREPAWRDEPLSAMGRAVLGGVAAAWTILVGLLVVTAAVSPALALLAAIVMLARTAYRRLA